jgi:Tfp pilus assembly pilus retraction ATPase PilT
VVDERVSLIDRKGVVEDIRTDRLHTISEVMSSSKKDGMTSGRRSALENSLPQSKLVNRHSVAAEEEPIH